ncbi:MAG: class I SAM-dependent methyltransferase [Canidatus Methanoxibalbensis ujae]|nr:class I SAM-dependent methyltransferase [Candidatus Methanoxibalbensis ujae]
MADFQAKIFNKKASDSKNKPDQIIEAIALKPGQSIADIGSGGGYFSLRFADIVREERRVYAVDTKPEFLEYVKNSAKEEGLNNVISTLVSRDKLNLSEKSLDSIFMRNVTHHIPNRVEYFKGLKRFLKPDERIAIIEYEKGKTFTFRGLFEHYVHKETIVQEMEEAGYLLERESNFLPEQHFTIYTSENEIKNNHNYNTCNVLLSLLRLFWCNKKEVI